MDAGERRLAAKGIAFFGALTVIFGLLHFADDIVRGEAERFGGTGGFALVTLLLTTLYVFGIGWAWQERKLGYGIVLALSVFPFFFGAFLSHALALRGAASLSAIATAYASEAVGVFFVFASLTVGVASLVTLLLSLYSLAVPKPG